MSNYVIGDIHACFKELELLLSKINFNHKQDTLWFTGDLINGGTHPIETLEFIKYLGNKAICVLGNHDLTLLYYDYLATINKDKKNINQYNIPDGFARILNHPQKTEYISWLKTLPLIHYDKKFNAVLVHAGIPPQWDLNTALDLAKQCENILQSNKSDQLFKNMFGDNPLVWQEDLTNWDRVRYILNSLTRMRFCNEYGKLELKSKGVPNKPPIGFKPWFNIENRKTKNYTIFFGHWATLMGKTNQNNTIGMDTGCMWGNKLSAYCLETKYTVAVNKTN